MNATPERMVAMIVADANTEIEKSNLIAGSTYAWNAALKTFGLTAASREASPVIDEVIRILCANREVHIVR